MGVQWIIACCATRLLPTVRTGTVQIRCQIMEPIHTLEQCLNRINQAADLVSFVRATLELQLQNYIQNILFH